MLNIVFKCLTFHCSPKRSPFTAMRVLRPMPLWLTYSLNSQHTAHSTFSFCLSLSPCLSLSLSLSLPTMQSAHILRVNKNMALYYLPQIIKDFRNSFTETRETICKKMIIKVHVFRASEYWSAQFLPSAEIGSDVSAAQRPVDNLKITFPMFDTSCISNH